VLGILGGGQLARMLIVAASRLGLRCCVYTASDNDVAAHICSATFVGELSDGDTVERFARAADVVTVETENIPLTALDVAGRHSSLRPHRDAVAVAQDRWLEKQFLSGIGIPTVVHARVTTEAELDEALTVVPFPAILKTARLGYDGHGQVPIQAPVEGRSAWESLGMVDCVLEQRVGFTAEMSVVAARSADGVFVPFDPGRNRHEGGILRSTAVPSGLGASVHEEAIEATRVITESLSYVGVIGVEFFVLPGNHLVVNEIAPRVHNSGHWTQNGCVIDQFEQHVRAVMGLPLGDGSRHSDVTMVNLLGEDVLDVDRYLTDPNAGVHVYGKAPVRPNRKMGHVNLRAPR
jgi:5-(carboxyamino)imidazole ribonucleotide synthase